MPSVLAGQSAGVELLPRLWNTPGRDLHLLWRTSHRGCPVLQQVRNGIGTASIRRRVLAVFLYAEAPRRTHPEVKGRPRGGAQACHGPLRRREELDGASG